MKIIFNSLGSNYDRNFVLLALRQLFWSDKKNLDRLEKKLQHYFSLKSTQASSQKNIQQKSVKLFYKGRDAIEYILASYGIGAGDEVLTQAFSCYAIEEAILRVGARPVFVDLAPGELNPSVKTLQAALAKLSVAKTTLNNTTQAKAVLIQHTLGSVADMLAIKKFCQHHQLLLIEDLAQGLGGVDAQGQPLGSHADAIILSFGRDKIIDAVSGGAAIFKTKPSTNSPQVITANSADKQAKTISRHQQLKDLFYPALTHLIRHSYQWQVGKIINFLARRLSLISNPILAPNQHWADLPSAHAQLALQQFDNLETQLAHRQQIAHYYYNNLKNTKTIQVLTTSADVAKGSNLRFAIAVEQAQATQTQKLIKHLAKQNIHLADRWYRAAVDCGNTSLVSTYQQGSCPNAEQLAAQVINLPTHRYINLRTAAKIVHSIKDFLN